MAYGPGGYMTGHEPLAREYAKNLTARRTGSGRGGNVLKAHKGIKEALDKDPKAAAEYLRTLNVGKVVASTGVRNPWHTRYEADTLPPHIASRMPEPTFHSGKRYKWNLPPEQEHRPSWIAERLTITVLR